MPFGKLQELAEWVRKRDEHAGARLALLERVASLDPIAGDGSDPERIELADRIERWRYQWLQHSQGSLDADGMALARELDLLMNALRGGLPRPARSLPEWLLEPTENEEAIEQVFDARVSTDSLATAALEATKRHASGADATCPGQTGRTILLYAPLYLSNHCINHCLYCSFRFPNAMARSRLEPEEVLAEANALRQRGFRHILLVAGEYPALVNMAYLREIVELLRQKDVSVAIEVAPQSTRDYSVLRSAGICGVTLYQETYDTKEYARVHPRGTKSWFDWRLEGPERAAEAGVDRLGLGILVGLTDPRGDFRALVRHGRYLTHRFPSLQLAFSLPRIHAAPPEFVRTHTISDELYFRLYCGLRLAFPDATLVLSTRETSAVRNRLARICITQMSAGSSTSPGGYLTPASPDHALEQFPVCDPRPPQEVTAYLNEQGISVRWQLDREPEVGSRGQRT